MARKSKVSFVREPARKRRVLYDADVVVAGSGLSSTFAAIAAGRMGARTVLVERFGSLGGNGGPGMICAGSLAGESDISLPNGLSGIPKELMARVRARIGEPPPIYAPEAAAFSQIAAEMMREAGVQVLLSARASDPIMDGNVVKGLFVECKGGRSAIRAKVTIDGTGDADIAVRAGAPITHYLPVVPANERYVRHEMGKPIYPTLYNDTQLHCMIVGVDMPKYQAFCAQEVELSEEDQRWAEPAPEADKAISDEAFKVRPTPAPKAIISALRKAWATSEYRSRADVEPNVVCSCPTDFRTRKSGCFHFGVTVVGAFDMLDPFQVSRLEAFTRETASRMVEFHRKNVPGWEKAFLVTAPFLGARGGPHIDAEHTLTPKESWDPSRFDDVIYRNTHARDHGGDPSGFDVPYRVTLPKGVEGLLVCGRGAGYLRRGHEPCGMRARPDMMVFGQCVGTAAAIAAQDGVLARHVDIRKVQRRLVADGIVLGDAARLKELGVG